MQITYVCTLSDKVEEFIHFWISNDKLHDTFLYNIACACIANGLKTKVLLSSKGVGFGPTDVLHNLKLEGHFTLCLYFVSRYYQLAGLEMMWSFFASRHGKGEHDGAGAVIKRTLTHDN